MVTELFHSVNAQTHLFFQGSYPQSIKSQLKVENTDKHANSHTIPAPEIIPLNLIL